MNILTNIVALVILYSSVRAQENCKTPADENGVCIIILNCPALLNIYQGPQPIPGSLVDLLAKLKCGNVGIMPKVCCELPAKQIKPSDPVVKDDSVKSPLRDSIVFTPSDYCTTPTGQSGTCINLKNCSTLLRFFQDDDPIPQSNLEFLRKSSCGFEGKTPKVCCENSRPDENWSANLIPTAAASLRSNFTTRHVDEQQHVHPSMRLLDGNICGRIVQPKIIGGENAGVLEFPWMALISYELDNSGKKEFRCGGSIISERYVLTAAHCVSFLTTGIKPIGVRVGEHNLKTERDCDLDDDGLEIVCGERYQDFLIEKIHYHDEYSPRTLRNDIALIRVNGDMDFRPANVKPICLPIGEGAAELHSKHVTVSGWGATETGPASPKLLRVTLSPVSLDECSRIYKTTQIWYKQMCAGGNSGKDSCQGDSGGPLQAPGIYNNNPRFIQYGIVSFGPRSCGVDGYPGVYTKVALYVNWILDHMGD